MSEVGRDHPLRVAVFASGGGTNFQAIVDAVHAGRLNASVELLVCDKPQAEVVQRAERVGVSVFAFRPRDYASREAYEREILAELSKRGIELVVLAGYMRIITQTLVEPYYGRMLNVHPSLLPAFPGINAVRQALDYGVKTTGVTIHYVDGGLDTGPIILQRAIAVQEGEPEEALLARIHAAEHELLPQAIALIAAGRVQLVGRRTVVLEGE